MKYRYTFICTLMVVMLLTHVPVWAADFTISDPSPQLFLNDTTAGEADWWVETDYFNEGFDIYNAETGTFPFVIENGAGSNLLFLDAAERIGINDGTPDYTLDVVGNAIFLGNADAAARNIMLRVNGTDADLETTTSDLYIRTPSANDLLLKPYDAYPTIGIGTTTPSYSLDINSTQPTIRFDDTSLGAGQAILDLNANELAIQGNTSQEIVEIDTRAPLHSLTINDTGWVGLDTLYPGGNLHIYSGATLDTFAGMGPDVINGPGFNYGYAGSTFGRGAGFFNVRPDASATGINPSLRFMTVNLERMVVTNAGNVGINNSAPASRLHVNGSVRVTGGSFIDDGTTLNVPDYVFEDDYKLMPLEELRTYVDEHKHLPGVKSAKEIADVGLDLSSSQMDLLEKVEELTLYTLQQQTQLDSKKQQLVDQAQRIAKLESMVDHLSQAVKTEKQDRQ